MSPDSATRRFPAAALATLADTLLQAAGADAAKAACVAHNLVGADAMGHSTHGLALLLLYLDFLAKGEMAGSGDWTVLKDTGACLSLDGHQLPGAWLIEKAIDLVLARIRQHGVVTVVLRRSHHTGALAVYLQRVAAAGYLMELQCSSPSGRGVAPFGGTRPVMTPNPVAAGYPTRGEPVLLDVSSSITTMNYARQLLARGERFPAPWVLDDQGRPTDDPQWVVNGKGSLLPTGGTDHGHKGYATALLTEALTQGLAGYGRADAPAGMSLTVLLRITDPEAFAGLDAFTRQTEWLAQACRSNPPVPGGPPVRLPGQAAQARQRQAAVDGVPLIPAVVHGLRAAAEARGVAARFLE